MYKVFFTFILLTLSPVIYSQNLVLNPSFEDYWYLPRLPAERDTFFCKNWYSYDDVAADYYTKNSKDTRFGVPLNVLGNHPAHSGNAYVGIVPINWEGYMEYVTGTLSEPLKKGISYKVSFYTEYAGKNAGFYISALGAYLSLKKRIYKNTFWQRYDQWVTPDIQAQIKNNDTAFIKNDTTWTLISGIYKAQGGEKYITIGFFSDIKFNMKVSDKFLDARISEKEKLKLYKKHQEILRINPDYVPISFFGKVECPYYFIDDVSVEEVKEK